MKEFPIMTNKGKEYITYDIRSNEHTTTHA